MDLLRFATAGSVDDGKSTLIGRLLFDSKQIFEDQLQAVELTSRTRGDDYVNLALLTDGLRAEREQGITIDVAYRYFATPARKFIIADTPGHVQYTRNMVTGASTADVALVLVDARKGLLEQSRRHATIAALLRVPHVVVCVNKMDLVDFRPEVFAEIREAFGALARPLGLCDVSFVPMAALHGDNVVQRSAKMAWYEGPSLLELLERIDVRRARADAPLRLPVQYVLRPMSSTHPDYRAYAGQLASGTVRPGQKVAIAPSGLSSTVAGVDLGGQPLQEATAPLSIAVRLGEELDVGRGDMLVDPARPPRVGQDFKATVCWMAQGALTPGARLWLKHTTRTTRVIVQALDHRLDVNTFSREEAPPRLSMNDLGGVTLRTQAPLAFDAYAENRITGSFILIDEATHVTVGAGMIEPS